MPQEKKPNRKEIAEARKALAAMLTQPAEPSIVIGKAGVHEVPLSVYLADPCPTPSLRSTLVRTLLKQSPGHAREHHPRLVPNPLEEEHSDLLAMGSIAHSVILEGKDVAKVLDFADWRTNASKEAATAARAEGKIPVLRKHWHDIERMCEGLRRELDLHPDGRAMFKDGVAERVLTWQEDNGVWCRARLDYLRDREIDDLKITRTSAAFDKLDWRYSLERDGWAIQAAFYMRGLRRILRREPLFRFCVLECYRPYALTISDLAPSALWLANDMVDKAVAIWGRCLESGDFPCYTRRTASIALPASSENAWVSRDYDEEVERA